MHPHHLPPPAERIEKKAYSAPKLVRLGSVRDLTFGTSKPAKPDGSFTRTSDK